MRSASYTSIFYEKQKSALDQKTALPIINLVIKQISFCNKSKSVYTNCLLPSNLAAWVISNMSSNYTILHLQWINIENCIILNKSLQISSKNLKIVIIEIHMKTSISWYAIKFKGNWNKKNEIFVKEKQKRRVLRIKTINSNLIEHRSRFSLSFFKENKCASPRQQPI